MAENKEEEYLDELLNTFRSSNTDAHEDEKAVTDEGTKSGEDAERQDAEPADGLQQDAEPADGLRQDAEPADGLLQGAEPMDGLQQDAEPADGLLQDEEMTDDFVLTEDDAFGAAPDDAPAADIMDMPVLEENPAGEVSAYGGAGGKQDEAGGKLEEADAGQDGADEKQDGAGGKLEEADAKQDEAGAGREETADIFALEENGEINDYQAEETWNEDDGGKYHGAEPEPEPDFHMEQNYAPEPEGVDNQPDDTVQDAGLMDLLNELGKSSRENGSPSGVNAGEAGAVPVDEKKSGGKGLFGRRKAAGADSSAEEAQDKAAAARKEKEEKKALKKAEKQARKLEKERQKADKKQAKAGNGSNENIESSEQPTEEAADLQGNMDLINSLYNEPEAQVEAPEAAESPENAPETEKKEKKPKKEKKKREPKPKREKKPKKEKREPKPSELVKVTPFTFLGIIIFTAAFTAFVLIATKLLSYNSSISAAESFFENGKYEQAYDSIAGLELKDKDLDTYYKIRAVMSIYADYSSYDNYRKVGMMVEALDSLINGLEHYDMYRADAEKYEVLTQYDGVREQIVSALAGYGVSVEDALYYGGLENEEQYIEILQNIGGIQQ